VVLVAAATFAIAVTTMLRGTVGYAAGVLWALVAVAIGAAQRDGLALSMAAVLAAALVVGMAVVGMRRINTAAAAEASLAKGSLDLEAEAEV